MSEQFLGEIRAFSFPFPPKGWAFCSGQLMAINQNTALFSLLGTQYGGDGIRTFALPNLNGKLAIGFGNSPGGQSYAQGETVGETSHTLIAQEMPAHQHNIAAAANGASNTGNTPGNTVVLGSASTSQAGTPPVNIYAANPNTPLATPLGAGPTASQPHNNQMPSLAMNYCIATVGIFPSRN